MSSGASPDKRRVRIVLAYDGTDYQGWQVQSRGRTIQGEVERILGRIAGNRAVRIRGAGRTDAGVHAWGQVADGRLKTVLGDGDLAHRLRRMLPATIRVRSVETVADDFDARRHAVSKRYAYRVDRTPYGNPFVHRYAMHYRRELDPVAVERGLAMLPGRRDWSGFAGANCEMEDRVRTVTEARWETSETECRFVFSGSGFLNHMVRNLVGTLLEIGRHRFEVSRIDEILESGDRRLAGPTAPAHGLCLEHVKYDMEDSSR